MYFNIYILYIFIVSNYNHHFFSPLILITEELIEIISQMLLTEFSLWKRQNICLINPVYSLFNLVQFRWTLAVFNDVRL